MDKKKISAMCATAAAVAALLVPGSAFAADDTLTISAGAGGSLAGHTFTAYQLASYSDVTVKDGNVSGFASQTPNAATEAWLKSALTANGVTVSGAGENAASALMKVRNSQQLLKIADKLASTAASSKITATGSQAATGASVSVTLPEGYYLVVDTQGVPILVSTTIQGASNMNGAKLGYSLVKTNVTTPDKKVQNNANQWVDDSSASNGQTKNFKVTLTIPNKLSVNTITIDDAMTGMSYVDGSFKAMVGNTNVTSMFGTPAKQASGDGFTVNSTHQLMESHEGEQLVLTYSGKVTNAAKANDAVNKVTVRNNFNPGVTPPTTNPPTDVVRVHTYDVNLKKVSAANTSKTLAGAKFRIYSNTLKAYGHYDANTHQWTFDASDTTGAKATDFVTGNDGVINFQRLGAGEYTVSETQVPAGYISSVKPSFSLTITDDGKISASGVEQSGLTDKITNADGKTTTPTVTVKNIDSLTQLPQTGAETMGILVFGAFAIILVATASGFAAYRIRHEHIDA